MFKTINDIERKLSVFWNIETLLFQFYINNNERNKKRACSDAKYFIVKNNLEAT